jgi:hypothetical protein
MSLIVMPPWDGSKLSFSLPARPYPGWLSPAELDNAAMKHLKDHEAASQEAMRVALKDRVDPR